eukprot:jgi/Phyca11/101101/e_gw1.5.1333.1
MWANHIRGKYFTAGNTTTNRIESNWNQVKLLLGKRPKIDTTVCGLLSHQATIIRQQSSAVFKHATTSRLPESWEVQISGYTHVCDDIMWTCSCLFYCSHQLPCRHLMYVAQCVHEFECMPPSSVPSRWDM